MKHFLASCFALALLCLPVQAQQLVTEQPNFYKNITTASTTVVKSSQGRLHAVTINNKGSTSTVTIYDGLTAAGTKIGTLTLTAENTQLYDVSFAAGLTVVTTGSSLDITVSYR